MSSGVTDEGEGGRTPWHAKRKNRAPT